MTATATKALRLAAKLVEFVAEADIDGEGFELGDEHFTASDLRDEIRRGLDSLRRGPTQIHALELHHRLTCAVDAAGSVAALARSMGVTKQYLHAVRSGHKPAGPTTLRHLGLRQVPRWTDALQAGRHVTYGWMFLHQISKDGVKISPLRGAIDNR